MFLLIFFTDAVGLNPALLSVMFLVTKLFDGVSDYVVGSLIDVTDTKLGRNKPWMLFGIPVYAIGLIMVFAAPQFASDFHLVYAYISYMIFCLGFTMINVPMNSIVPFMTSNPDERTSILTFGSLGGTLGVLIAMVGVPAMIQMNGGSNSISGYSKTAILLAIVASVIYSLCVLLTKEVNVPPKVKNESIIKNLRNIFNNRPFIVLLVYMLTNALSLACMTSVLTYYSKYYLHDESQVTILYLIFIAGSLVSLIFATPLGKRFSKKPLLMALLSIQMIAWIGCWFAETNLIMLYIFVGLMALAAGVMNPNVFAILSESIDYGEYKTGRNLAGTQTAIFGLFNKIGSALASSVVAFILYLGKYDSKLTVQPDSAIFSIRFSLSGVCLICTIIGFIAMSFYPITKKKMVEITKGLEQSRKTTSTKQ
ncbi:MFS transporter [Enterococcus faecium]|nr:MFS transporter [Enterococcus faecium]